MGAEHVDPASGTLTAVIVDDHPAIVAGVAAWCSDADPPITLIDADARIARLWTDRGATADVIVLDLHLGQRPPAFNELGKLVEAGRRVIVYSQRADTETALTCLDIGAFTYLTKAEGKDHLVSAIRACAADQPYTPPCLAGAMLADTQPVRPALSHREKEVMLAWFTSASKQMAATTLGLSVKSVETYLDRARLKYADVGRPAPTKTALLQRAMQDGLIGLDDCDVGRSPDPGFLARMKP